MPRSHAVGSRYNHSETSYDKCQQSCHHTQRRGELEAEERDVEMQEIASPDAECIEKIERFVLHLAQREDTRLDVVHDLTQLGKYRQFADGIPQEQCCDNHTCCCDNISRRGECLEPTCEARSRLVEEADERLDLQQENDE